jgi:hypothetical protein
LEDIADDSWMVLGARIRRGVHPEIKHLASALRRGENIPPDIQVYIAGLPDGSVSKRGRPKKWTDPMDLMMFAGDNDRDRRYYNLGMRWGGGEGSTALEYALDLARRRHSISRDTAEKYYRKGRTLWKAHLRTIRGTGTEIDPFVSSTDG